MRYRLDRKFYCRNGWKNKKKCGILVSLFKLQVRNMAEIRKYDDEVNRRNEQEAREKAYMRHKRWKWLRFVILGVILVAVCAFVFFYYSGKTYSGYEVTHTVARTKVDGSVDVKLGNSVLTYSQDGAHCVDMKGTMTWNQSFEIQDLKLATCQNMSAICGYNGHEIYVQSTDKQMGEIQTNLPIKNITVSGNGFVTAVLEDTNVIWMNTYNPEGQNVYEGQFHMSQSGYPCAISLSPNGELLAVSFIFVEEGNVVSNVAFYNYGPVGDNQSDQLVSTYTYRDMLIPEIHFMTDSAAFAVGDNRLMFYSGAQVPTTKNEAILDGEVKAVYYDQNYVGIIFTSDRSESKYVLKIYNNKGDNILNHYFDMDYLGVFFEEKNFVIYNASECVVYSMAGMCKYQGKFQKAVNLMLPTDMPYHYRLVTEDSIDLIQLN